MRLSSGTRRCRLAGGLASLAAAIGPLPIGAVPSDPSHAIAAVSLPNVRQDGPPPVAAPDLDSADADEVLIDGVPVIGRREIDRLAVASVDPSRLTEEERQLLREQARRQLIGRRLILMRLGDEGHLPSAAEIDGEIKSQRERLAVLRIDWQTHLDELGIDETAYRESIRWKLAWTAELDRRLTESNLRKYFEDRRAEFDGTEVEVSQIVLPLPVDADATQVERTRERLTEIRREIVAEERTFEAAARAFSAGESAADGGKLGRIARHGAMPEAFAAAAFGLETGEISEPIRTGIGWHLIRADARFAGNRTLEQVLPEVRTDAMKSLFDWMVAQEQPKHTIEIRR